MAKRNDGRDDELEALKQIPGIDVESITKQINKTKGIEEPIPPTPPATKVPPVTPPVTPPATPPVTPPKTDVPNPETIRAAMLNEMFGEQYKTVEDVKKANIPASLQELATLRQRAQELEAQLAKKPKHNFASDDIAKFNEFARETGIKDPAVFNRLNATEVANMTAMDALVMQHIIDNPDAANREPQVRRYLERRYDVDSAKINHKRVEDGEITEDEYQQLKLDYESNLEGANSDGNKAKAKLAELKSKIKMPEIPADESDTKSKWTPEVESKAKEVWTGVNEKMGEVFSKIPVILEGAEEPVVNFVLPEEIKKKVLQNAMDYVVSNQLEANEANVRSVAQAMYSDIIMTNFPKIAHAIFERARTITEDEMLKVYHNPSPKNTDNPPAGGESKDDDASQKAFQLEMGR